MLVGDLPADDRFGLARVQSLIRMFEAVRKGPYHAYIHFQWTGSCPMMPADAS